jgi:hypothetical protein
MRASTIALLFVTVAACSASAQSKEDSAIFDATLARFSADYRRTHQGAPSFLVFNESAAVLAQDVGLPWNELPKGLVDALLLNNSVPQSIAAYSPPTPFQLSSPAMLGAVLQIAKPGLARSHYYNWDLLHTRFPGVPGILELAAPAYAPDGSSALVYFWTGCGDLCATGYVYMLEKSNGTWRVVRAFSPWVS